MLWVDVFANSGNDGEAESHVTAGTVHRWKAVSRNARVKPALRTGLGVRIVKVATELNASLFSFHFYPSV